MKPGIPTPVKLTAYSDRTFTFVCKTPPTSWFLKKAANIDKGSSRPGLDMVGKVTLKQIYEIARIKQKDVKRKPGIPMTIYGLCRCIAGTARSMGIEVVDGKDMSSEDIKKVEEEKTKN